jgi:transcription elongation factor Elf1
MSKSKFKRLNTIATFQCAYCGAENDVEFDPTVSRSLAMTEDCAVCCRPNLVRITVDEDTMEPIATADMDM